MTVTGHRIHGSALPETVTPIAVTVRSERRHRVGLRVRPGGRAYPMGGAGVPEPHVLAEAVRQAGVAVMRSGLAVPADFRVALKSLWFARSGSAGPVGAGGLVAEVECTEVRRRGPHVTGFDFTARITDGSGGRLYGRGGGEIGCLSPAVYRFVRAQQHDSAGPPADAAGDPFDRERLLSPELVGLASADEVLLAEPPGGGTGGWRLAPDLARLGESADHVPGAVLIAAGVQAAVAKGWSKAVAGASATFLRHAGLTSPVDITVGGAGPAARQDGVVATLRQGGEVVCRVGVETGPGTSGK